MAAAATSPAACCRQPARRATSTRRAHRSRIARVTGSRRTSATASLSGSPTPVSRGLQEPIAHAARLAQRAGEELQEQQRRRVGGVQIILSRTMGCASPAARRKEAVESKSRNLAPPGRWRAPVAGPGRARGARAASGRCPRRQARTPRGCVRRRRGYARVGSVPTASTPEHPGLPAAAPADLRPARLGERRQFVREPGLADTGLAGDQEHRHAPRRGRFVERRPELGEPTLTPYERFRTRRRRQAPRPQTAVAAVPRPCAGDRVRDPVPGSPPGAPSAHVRVRCRAPRPRPGGRFRRRSSASACRPER